MKSYKAKFSPDGRFIAYVSNESGTHEVYVLDFPDAAGKWQISNEGGVPPQWSDTGLEIFYIAPDERLMAVDVSVSVSGEPELEVGIPRALFTTQIWSGASAEPGIRAQYDVSADGERFLINRARPGQAGVEIHVVLDFFSTLVSHRGPMSRDARPAVVVRFVFAQLATHDYDSCAGCEGFSCYVMNAVRDCSRGWQS